MTTGKGGAAAPSSSSPQKPPECCMCGDYGLSYELFNCKICQFRSQHRYCSNLYPKAESYRVCNWCLIQRDGTQITTTHSEKTPGCSPNSEDDHQTHLMKRKKINGGDCNINHVGGGGGTPKGRMKDRLQQSLQVSSSRPIKKQPRSPEGLPSPAARKKGGEEERLRRTKSEDVMNKQVIVRNKVRRYKLLDEVSTQ